MRAVCCSILLSACALAGGDDATNAQESGATQYVGIADFSGIDQGAWFDAAHGLNDQFTASGEYPGIVPLSFNCSVTSKLGSVHDCAWTFASAPAQVDGTTAAIAVDAATYQCHVHPKTTAAKLIPLLSLHGALPGMGSIDDTLADCFAHPIGGTALPPPSSGTTYVEASAYYATAAYQAKWQAANAAVVLGFDNVCGDTFCGGDFGDMESLDLACAITKSSGNVKSCSWIIGGSYALPAANGTESVTSQTWRCDFTMHGTLPQLIAVWTGTDPANDVIHRPLPGVITSAYDALLGCLP
jgi:hypothetical protein